MTAGLRAEVDTWARAAAEACDERDAALAEVARLQGVLGCGCDDCGYVEARRAEAEARMISAEATVERLTQELTASQREADRLRHGVPVEGDFVCPDSLAMSEARAEIARLRAEVARLTQERAPWLSRAAGGEL